MKKWPDRTRRPPKARQLSAAVLGALAAGAVLAGMGGAAPAATPPSNTSPPTISGEAKEGETLTASSGTWSGSTPMAFDYRWLRCDSSGGSCSERNSGQTRTLGSGDIGHRMRVTATATNSAGSSSATSASTDVVLGSAPRNTSLPTLSGRARQGDRLSINRGSWTGDPDGFDYAWQRCDSAGNNCSLISGQTDRTYRLTGDDVGRTLRGVVTARNENGSTSATTKQSDVVTVRGVAPANTSPPTISGSPQEGQTLSASPGTWTGTGPVAFRYSWERCDKNGRSCAVLPVSSTQYKLVSADVGRTMRVAVTGSNGFGARTALSNPTPVVTSTLPPGAVRLPDGTISVDVSTVSLPQRLIIDRVQYSPSRIRSRDEPLVAHFRVVDTRGYVVRGALVYALGVPFDRLSQQPEVYSREDGWAEVTFRVLPTFPLKRGNLVVIFVRARKSGENVLAGVSTRRLVSVRVA